MEPSGAVSGLRITFINFSKFPANPNPNLKAPFSRDGDFPLMRGAGLENMGLGGGMGMMGMGGINGISAMNILGGMGIGLGNNNNIGYPQLPLNNNRQAPGLGGLRPQYQNLGDGEANRKEGSDGSGFS